MNHDLTGIRQLLNAQKEHIKRIKFLTRVDNEKYLREHPEIEFILQTYLIKLLEDRPAVPIKYSGEYFNKTDFRSLYENQK